ncbi:MAG: radical SAM protein [Anaerolineaceae bacterium]|nr:radical SAM protein [Anaerolineaceae bacterium]
MSQSKGRLSQNSQQESARQLPEQSFLPQAYHLPQGKIKGSTVQEDPHVVFIEITNHCNLLCQTCPHTYFQREPLKSLSYAEFVAIAEQFPYMQRALLHGIGEPLLNRQLPDIIRYLKQRGVEVIINSNGTLLSQPWQDELVNCGLDEFRCSIDSAREETYTRIRGANLLPKLVAGLQGLLRKKEAAGSQTPRISIWCVATRENLAELPDLIHLAARAGVREVYVQRLVYFAQDSEKQFGMARDELAIFGKVQEIEAEVLKTCTQLSAELGIDFRASGARQPLNSLAAARPADYAPWQECLRPWTTAYVTANGNCLPCCIAPFATDKYESLILGNLFEQSFGQIWNGPSYQAFRLAHQSQNPHEACLSCGVNWSL